MRSVEQGGGGRAKLRYRSKTRSRGKLLYGAVSQREEALKEGVRTGWSARSKLTAHFSPSAPWRSLVFTGTAPDDTASSSSHAKRCGHKYFKLSSPGDVCCHEWIWITDLACEREQALLLTTPLVYVFGNGIGR